MEDLRAKMRPESFIKAGTLNVVVSIPKQNLDRQIISDVPQNLENWAEHFDAFLYANTTDLSSVRRLHKEQHTTCFTNTERSTVSRRETENTNTRDLVCDQIRSSMAMCL